MEGSDSSSPHEFDYIFAKKERRRQKFDCNVFESDTTQSKSSNRKRKKVGPVVPEMSTTEYGEPSTKRTPRRSRTEKLSTKDFLHGSRPSNWYDDDDEDDDVNIEEKEKNTKKCNSDRRWVKKSPYKGLQELRLQTPLRRKKNTSTNDAADGYDSNESRKNVSTRTDKRRSFTELPRKQGIQVSSGNTDQEEGRKASGSLQEGFRVCPSKILVVDETRQENNRLEDIENSDAQSTRDSDRDTFETKSRKDTQRGLDKEKQLQVLLVDCKTNSAASPSNYKEIENVSVVQEKQKDGILTRKKNENKKMKKKRFSHEKNRYGWFESSSKVCSDEAASLEEASNDLRRSSNHKETEVPEFFVGERSIESGVNKSKKDDMTSLKSNGVERHNRQQLEPIQEKRTRSARKQPKSNMEASREQCAREDNREGSVLKSASTRFVPSEACQGTPPSTDIACKKTRSSSCSKTYSSRLAASRSRKNKLNQELELHSDIVQYTDGSDLDLGKSSRGGTNNQILEESRFVDTAEFFKERTRRLSVVPHLKENSKVDSVSKSNNRRIRRAQNCNTDGHHGIFEQSIDNVNHDNEVSPGKSSRARSPPDTQMDLQGLRRNRRNTMLHQESEIKLAKIVYNLLDFWEEQSNGSFQEITSTNKLEDSSSVSGLANRLRWALQDWSKDCVDQFYVESGSESEDGKKIFKSPYKWNGSMASNDNEARNQSHSRIPSKNASRSHSRTTYRKPRLSYSGMHSVNQNVSHSRRDHRETSRSHSRMHRTGKSDNHSRKFYEERSPSHSQINYREKTLRRSRMDYRGKTPSHSRMHLPEQYRNRSRKYEDSRYRSRSRMDSIERSPSCSGSYAFVHQLNDTRNQNTKGAAKGIGRSRHESSLATPCTRLGESVSTNFSEDTCPSENYDAMADLSRLKFNSLYEDLRTLLDTWKRKIKRSPK